jgi:hypothetical protein
MWRTLGAFTVRGGPAGERQVAERLAKVARRFAFPAELLEQIEVSLIRATTIAHGWKSAAGARQEVEVRVLVSEARSDMGPHGRRRSNAPQAPSQPEKPADELAQGWGYFLVERPAEDARASTHHPARHHIELYLYPEGARSEGENV